MQCTPRAILHQPRVQPILRPPLQRAEHSELEELTEKQWRLQCFALLCFAFKLFFGQDERYQRHGNIEIQKLGSPCSTNDPTTEVTTDDK